MLPKEIALYNALIVAEQIRIRNLGRFADIPPDLVASLAEFFKTGIKVSAVFLVAARVVEKFVVVSLVAVAVHGKRGGLRTPDTDIRLTEIDDVDLCGGIVISQTAQYCNLAEACSDKIGEVRVRVAVVKLH